MQIMLRYLSLKARNIPLIPFKHLEEIHKSIERKIKINLKIAFLGVKFNSLAGSFPFVSLFKWLECNLWNHLLVCLLFNSILFFQYFYFFFTTIQMCVNGIKKRKKKKSLMAHNISSQISQQQQQPCSLLILKEFFSNEII